MHIIPVLDLMNGVVVRGVAGRRAEYRPVVSRLTTSTEPLDVARAFRDHFGLSELYLADLDAIQGGQPSLPLIELMHADGFRLWVDAGVRTAADADGLAQIGVAHIVAGLETLRGPDMLRDLVATFGPESIVFSLDLQDGMPMGELQAWQATDPYAIAERARHLGVSRFLVLDLRRVGTGQGTGTDDLCRRLSMLAAPVHVTAGGGIRHADDVRRLGPAGVSSVLVASALHDGRISPHEVRELETR